MAVSAISPMPPGVVAITAVDQCSPEPFASTNPKAAAATRYPSVISATAARNRGAARKNSGVKWMPSEMPISSCPAFTTATGSAENVWPVAVITAAASSGPIIQLLGEPKRSIAAAAPSVTATSTAKPTGSNTRASGVYGSSPCTSSQLKSSGTISTTSMMRRLCAAATRSTRPPCRCACAAISLAPPIAIAKNDVVTSAPVARASTQLPSAPSAIANRMASASHGARRTTSRMTSGEK